MAGPVTVETSTLALGLAQIRVGDSSTNIAKIEPQFTSADSIGSLTNTKFVGNTDWYEHESGFPLKKDYAIAIRDNASIEGTFEEIKPYNLALAYGIDPSSDYDDVHTGEIALGGRTSPEYVRIETYYEFPNGDYAMNIIFPRGQVKSSIEIDMQAETAAGIPVVIDSNISSSDVTDGDAVWDAKPLGRILFSSAE